MELNLSNSVGLYWNPEVRGADIERVRLFSGWNEIFDLKIWILIKKNIVTNFKVSWWGIRYKITSPEEWLEVCLVLKVIPILKYCEVVPVIIQLVTSVPSRVCYPCLSNMDLKTFIRNLWQMMRSRKMIDSWALNHVMQLSSLSRVSHRCSGRLNSHDWNT